ncbi:von Willebrand factor type A domain protein [Cooperia oncophora]
MPISTLYCCGSVCSTAIATEARRRTSPREMFRMEPTGGTTKTGEALHYAIKEFADKKHGARKNARKFIVLFTDGYAQDDPVEAADTAREQGITVLAVAVEDRFKPNEQELVEVTKNRDVS